MPTSSIFTNIVINDPEKVEKFIDALEASSHDPAWQAASPIKQPLTDIEKIYILHNFAWEIVLLFNIGMEQKPLVFNAIALILASLFQISI